MNKLARVPLLHQSDRVPLATIDSVVSAELGPARVAGNAQPNVFFRQVAMYLARHTGGWSTTQIGRFYNGRDHSTVCYSIRKIERARTQEPGLNSLLSCLEQRCLEEATNTSQHRRASFSGYNELEDRLDQLAERIADQIISRLIGQRTGIAN